MTAAVRRQDAKSVCVTGTAGALVIAIAIAMMVLSAPSHPHPRPHGPAVLTAKTVSYPSRVIVSAVQAPR